MTDLSYKNWGAMSDKALVGYIGAFVKHHRLKQNKTQSVLANAAGISRSTLSLLERGEIVTLATLIQTLRVLDQLHVMEPFTAQKSLSPLALAKIQKEKRQRARRKQKNSKQENDWSQWM